MARFLSTAKAGGAVALGLLAGAAALAADKVYRCPQPGGGVELSQIACRPAGAPPAPPPATPCPMGAEQRARAERLESVFLQRHPSERSHRDAQMAELRAVELHIRTVAARFAELARERKAIDEELEFYRGKSPPAELARRLDANEAQFGAIADVFRNDVHAVRAVDAKFACERATFGALWGGGAPGSSACAAACPGTGP